MIPLRDTIPSRQAPVVTWALIFVNVLVFLYELALPPEQLEALFYLFGIVPARYSHPEWAMAVGFPIDSYWPFITSMFLHGGWLHVIINADIAEKAINQLRESAAELLTRSMPGEKAKELAARLSTGTWTHDYPITVEEAQRLGLNARSDIDADILQLMTLYPQPIRRQPTVEYLPGQRHAPPKREGS